MFSDNKHGNTVVEIREMKVSCHFALSGTGRFLPHIKGIISICNKNYR